MAKVVPGLRFQGECVGETFLSVCVWSDSGRDVSMMGKTYTLGNEPHPPGPLPSTAMLWDLPQLA